MSVAVAPPEPTAPAVVVAVDAADLRRLKRGRSAALFVAPLVLLAAVGGAGAGVLAWLKPAKAPGTPGYVPWAGDRLAAAATPPDGAAVFAAHCAYCHGPNGDGNGSANLDPRARYFGAEKFKFATIDNGQPTDADLVAVLRRGVPGSAMPSFNHLPKADLLAVSGHVRRLARKGLYDALWRKAAKDEDPDPAEVAKQVQAVADAPGKPLELPAEFPAATAKSLANGRRAFAVGGCAACHGLEGRGDGSQTKDPNFRNDDWFKTPARPRDLTQGVFKGGREKKDIYARIRLGIPGTPMPDGKALPRQDALDLVNYVLSLSGG